jgi:hypothetical protein
VKREETMIGSIARHLPSPSMAVALLALLVALGGTSYAAINLPRNSVGSRELKPNAITGAKVKDRSLFANDFASGQLPRGPQGPAGPAGPAGAQGPQGPGAGANILFARVTANGSLLPDGRGAVSAGKIDGNPAFNNYGVTFDRDISNCAWSVSLYGFGSPSAPGVTQVDGTVNTIRVDQADTGGGQGLHLLVVC